MYVAGEGATVIEGGGGEEGVWISYGYPQCRSCVASGSGARHCWCSRTPPCTAMPRRPRGRLARRARLCFAGRFAVNSRGGRGL